MVNDVAVSPAVLISEVMPNVIVTDESADALKFIGQAMKAIKAKYPEASVTLTIYPDLSNNLEAVEYHGCGNYDHILTKDFDNVEALISYALSEWIKPADE